MNVLIVGLARSGYGAAKILLKENHKVTIIDAQEPDEQIKKELEALGAKIIIEEVIKQPDLLDKNYDLVVKNPGIKTWAPIVKKAKQLGIKITTEIEVAFNHFPENTKVVAITGSNGKTTSTSMIYSILKHAGLNVHVGGNIGIAATTLIDNMTGTDNIAVLEISGHQLHDIENFKADIAVLTNLKYVHADHYKTFDEYKTDKKRVFENQTEKDLSIINLNDEEVMNTTKNIKSRKKTFSLNKASDIKLVDNEVIYNNEVIINKTDLKIPGLHNIENAMCAILVAKELGINNQIIKEALALFNGVEHRIEFVREINNVRYYNDSKSSNTLALTTALKSFSTPLVLLMGGQERDQDFSLLDDYMSHVKQIITYGENKNKVKKFADRNKIKVIVLNNLKEAVIKSTELAEKGDVVLLSPASASWDQYESFEHRGDEFKKIVKKLQLERSVDYV